MTGLIIVFIDKTNRRYTIFRNQSSFKWTKIFRYLCPKEYTMRHFGGHRKEINMQNCIKTLKGEGFRENKNNLNFEKIMNISDF